jgi:threonine/homoserine/homoserine lactone efflux protein
MNAWTLLSFLLASVALTLAPGPDNTFVVAQGISRGRRAAVAAALGMASGISVHTTAAALGVSALLYSSAWAFTALKFAGATYLLWLAVKSLREQTLVLRREDGAEPTGFAMYRRGFIMNVLNPKVALFFLAFLPQFVSVNAGRAAPQMMLLGLVFMVQAAILFSVIGWLSGSVGALVLKRPHIAKYFGWATAGIFASLGVKLALARQ